MTRYSAVLFDFDGVLARTMEDNYAAWADAFAAAGIALERGEYFVLEGAPTRQVAHIILEKYGRDVSHAPAVAAHKEAYYIVHHSFALYDGVMELLDALSHSGLKLGLVSGAGRARLTTTCGNAFLDRFDVVITADDVCAGKPNPEPYLTAASRLGAAPDECLVVENAPLGIRAAKSAGMDCVALTTTLDARFLTEADAVLASLGEVSAVVSSR